MPAPPPAFSQQFFDQWNFGFNLSWELDLWGRLRRAVTAAERTLDASCANYDDVLVTLLGDVASNYVQLRTLQDRIRLATENVKLQADIVHAAERRFKVGSIRARAVDAPQARSVLAQTEAQIPQLNMELRQACDRLCVLMGVPPADLERQLGFAPIPTAPTAVAVGIPADLLRRRPDVRRAQHEALAQGERIGIAEAELYPAFFINGTLGYSAQNLPQIVREQFAYRHSRAGLPVEHPQLRPYPQQRPHARCPLPSPGGGLPEYRLASQRRSRGWLGDVPAGPGTGPVARQERGQHARGGGHRLQGVQRGQGRLQPGGPD